LWRNQYPISIAPCAQPPHTPIRRLGHDSIAWPCDLRIPLPLSAGIVCSRAGYCLLLPPGGGGLGGVRLSYQGERERSYPIPSVTRLADFFDFARANGDGSASRKVDVPVPAWPSSAGRRWRSRAPRAAEVEGGGQAPPHRGQTARVGGGHGRRRSLGEPKGLGPGRTRGVGWAWHHSAHPTPPESVTARLPFYGGVNILEAPCAPVLQ